MISDGGEGIEAGARLETLSIRLMMKFDVSRKRSTQLVRQDCVRWSSLVLGLSTMQASQQRSVKPWTST